MPRDQLNARFNRALLNALTVICATIFMANASGAQRPSAMEASMAMASVPKVSTLSKQEDSNDVLASLDAWQKIKLALSSVELSDSKDPKWSTYIEKVISKPEGNHDANYSLADTNVSIFYDSQASIVRFNTSTNAVRGEIIINIVINRKLEYSPSLGYVHTENAHRLCINYSDVREDLKNLGWDEAIVARGNEGVVLPLLALSKMTSHIVGHMKFALEGGGRTRACLSSVSLTKYDFEQKAKRSE